MFAFYFRGQRDREEKRLCLEKHSTNQKNEDAVIGYSQTHIWDLLDLVDRTEQIL